MISRLWRGLAYLDQAAAYEDHLRLETFPALKKIDGFVGASILRRECGTGVEFLVLTRWTSMAAIEKFAGADPELAVVPEKVQMMMIDYDQTVKHYGEV